MIQNTPRSLMSGEQTLNLRRSCVQDPSSILLRTATLHFITFDKSWGHSRHGSMLSVSIRTTRKRKDSRLRWWRIYTYRDLSHDQSETSGIWVQKTLSLIVSERVTCGETIRDIVLSRSSHREVKHNSRTALGYCDFRDIVYPDFAWDKAQYLATKHRTNILHVASAHYLYSGRNFISKHFSDKLRSGKYAF